MGTPGSGRKRTPVKDRFSAEDEALSNIAREVCLENPLSTLSCTVGNIVKVLRGDIYIDFDSLSWFQYVYCE